MRFDFKSLRTHERAISSVTLFAVGILASFDIWSDSKATTESFHLVFESVIAAGSLLGALVLITNFRGALKQVSADAERWKAESSKLTEGLSRMINEQLDRWKLTPAEKEVALLLLKGMSHKEIADIRSTSEASARQQAYAVYQKSGLGGRAELSAFFLEDLLVISKD